MKTVIMAGGRGSRLAGITENASAVIPKPMVPVEGKPLLERTVGCLKAQGFTDLILTVGWKRQRYRSISGTEADAPRPEESLSVSGSHI